MSEQSVSMIRLEAARQVQRWLEMLGDKAEPPPYSESRKTAWRAGYDDALRDLAMLRAKGRSV